MIERICSFCGILIRREYWGEDRYGHQTHGSCKSCRATQIEHFKKVLKEVQQDGLMRSTDVSAD